MSRDDEWEGSEAASIELRLCLHAYVGTLHEFDEWKKERDTYFEALKAAVANNLEPPAPLRPHSDGPLGEEEYLRRIAQEGGVN